MTAVCDGCLGTRRCWVCLGTGVIDREVGRTACQACAGSGSCALCRPTTVVDLTPGEDEPAVDGT